MQLTELNRHTEICDACSEEFEQCCLMWDIIKKALEPATGAEEAKKALLERLSEDDLPRSLISGYGWNTFTW